VVLLGGCAYVLLGVPMAGRQGGSSSSAGGGGGSGIRSHPHYSHWLMLAALCADGLAFARGTRRRGGLATLRAPLAVRQQEQEVGDQGVTKRRGGSNKVSAPAALPRRSRSKTGGKDKQAPKKGHRSTRSKCSRMGSGGDKAAAEPPGPPPPPPPSGPPPTRTGQLAGGSAGVPTPVREWQPTRSAHLATGARETGVKVQL
jgi:hypothetical protein